MQIRIPLLLLRSWLPLITLPQHQAFDSHGVSVYQCIINRALAGCIPRNRTRTRAAARLCAQRPQLVCAHKGRSSWSDAGARRPTDDQRMTVRKAHQVVGQNWSDWLKTVAQDGLAKPRVPGRALLRKMIEDLS